MTKTVVLLLAFIITVNSNVYSQTIYTVNSNSNYSANCNNCTFNITSGVTLTINQSGTCNSCTFNGGAIAVNNSITCQPCSFNNNNIVLTNQAINPNSATTSFTNVVLTANGTSSILANTPVNISNSTFTFNGTSYFNNNGGQLDISNSILNFYGNAYFIANAGPVNLRNATKLVAGNGLISSQAYIKMNGPVLNIYDNASSIVLGNNNNYYFNWASYNSLSNSRSFSTTYPNTGSTYNCGGTGQNACGMWSNPVVFGPSAFSSQGVVNTSSLLPIVLNNFSINNNLLVWSTASEVNADYFNIEYSANGNSWQKIGTVPAKGSMADYTFAVSDAGYYRLAMVDKDGTKDYSTVKTLRAAVAKGVSFYPNPAVDEVHIVLSSQSTVQLIDQSGQLLQERKSNSNISLNVAQYPRGIYILKIILADGTQQSSKLMIAH